MSYSVKYRYRDQWRWKRLHHVVDDGYASESTYVPIRFFTLTNGTRVEIPAEDTEIRILPEKANRQDSAQDSSPAPSTAASPPQPAKQEGLSPKQRGSAYAKLAEVYFWLGEYSESSADKDHYFGQGVEAGKKAVELVPDSVAANLWYGANMGSHGVVRGIMSSLFYLGPIEKHGKRAMEIDESYFYGAPLRLMGRFYHQAPGFPIGPGDSNKGIEILEKAVQVGPDFLYNHVYLAEVYMAKRRKDEARELLEDVLNRPVPEKYPKHHEMVTNEAQKLLEKL